MKRISVIQQWFIDNIKEKEMDRQFYANVAQAVITPLEPSYLVEPNGELSTGIHDDLYVKAMYPNVIRS